MLTVGLGNVFRNDDDWPDQQCQLAIGRISGKIRDLRIHVHSQVDSLVLLQSEL